MSSKNHEGYFIVRGRKDAEPKFRKAISKQAIDKYGIGPYPPDSITEILQFYKDYFIVEFSTICRNEKSYQFYREIFFLHQNATRLRHSEDYNDLPEGLDHDFLAMYRRILKMILEEGCFVDMKTGEKRNLEFTKRIDPIINDLLFLGEMIYKCGILMAESSMIEDCVGIRYNDESLYLFDRKYHYEGLFLHLRQEHQTHQLMFVGEENATEKFLQQIKLSFGFEWEEFIQLMIDLYDYHKIPIGEGISLDVDNFYKDLENQLPALPEKINLFMSGLILRKEKKMPIDILVKKPHSLERLIYRPFLQWNINDKDYFITSNETIGEALDILCQDAFPYGKLPTEWSACTDFTKFVNERRKVSGILFEQRVTSEVKQTDCYVQGDLKTIINASGTFDLVKQGPGQIDILIVSPILKTVFISECKNMQGRYDIINQRNDFGYFTKDSSNSLSYNNRLRKKLGWVNDNKKKLEEHIRLKFENPLFEISQYQIEGIFVINTPTFYMWNSEFKIYTFDKIKDVVLGQHTYKPFSYTVFDDDSIVEYKIPFPYFQKPMMIYLEEPDDDEECDIYGDPIKKA